MLQQLLKQLKSPLSHQLKLALKWLLVLKQLFHWKQALTFQLRVMKLLYFWQKRQLKK